MVSGVSAYEDDQAEGASRGDKHQKMERMIEELGLTSEQAEQLRQHKEAKRDGRKESYGIIREKHEAIKEELNKAEIDKVKIEKLIEEIVNIQTQALRERIEHMITLKEILTAEQFEKFQEKMEKKRQGFKEKKRWHKKHGTCNAVGDTDDKE